MLPAFRLSSPEPISSSEETNPPFILEHRSLDLQNDGTFTPDAAVLLSSTLLESRLLLDLTPTDLQTLLTVLCCLTSNGTFVATSEALALRLHLWPGQMRARLQRLITKSWAGEPLLRTQTTESGLRLYAPSPALFGTRDMLVFPSKNTSGTPLEPPTALHRDGARVIGGLREAVVEHSRATYGRPRAEVEAEINRFLGSERNPALSWPGPVPHKQIGESSGLEAAATESTEILTPEETAKRELGRRLIAQGLSAEQARFLVDSFPADLIERQLSYLPYRHARNPAGMLMASVEGDYAPPLAFRHATIENASTIQAESEVERESGKSVQTEGASDLHETQEVAEDLPPLQSELPDAGALENSSLDGDA